MYNNNPGSSASPKLTTSVNNPFLEESAANRFPEIDPSPPQPPFQPALPYSSGSLFPATSQFHQQQPYGASQQNIGWNSQSEPPSLTYGTAAFSGYPTPQQHFSSSAFLGPQYDHPSSYGGQPRQLTGYPQYQQQSPTYAQQYQQSIIGQFDPYSGQQPQTAVQSGVTYTSDSSNTARTGPSGQQHPRQYIKTHKVELESWNESIWKQALSTFEDLKRAWEKRRAEVQRQLLVGQYLTAEDITYLNELSRNAESSIDSVVASLIQMREVHTGYKQSLDAASKKRVREALNAGLQGLPEWP